MIEKTFKDTVDIRSNNKVILFVYKGTELVWQAIRSCFGKGYWINRYPWLNRDKWKNTV